MHLFFRRSHQAWTTLVCLLNSSDQAWCLLSYQMVIFEEISRLLFPLMLTHGLYSLYSGDCGIHLVHHSRFMRLLSLLFHH